MRKRYELAIAATVFGVGFTRNVMPSIAQAADIFKESHNVSALL